MRGIEIAYLVIGFDPVTFAMFTPKAFMDPERATEYMADRQREDKASFFRIEEIPLDIIVPAERKKFYEQ